MDQKNVERNKNFVKFSGFIHYDIVLFHHLIFINIVQLITLLEEKFKYKY